MLINIIRSVSHYHKSKRYIQKRFIIINDFKEIFVHQVRFLPLHTYQKFYNNQFNANSNNEVIHKIIRDIDMRLSASSVLQMEEFKDFKKSLEESKDKGKALINSKTINPEKLYTFIIDYVETMDSIFKSCDSNIIGTYHTNFAKDFMEKIYYIGNNTQLFFTFENMDDSYFIDIRPTCIYAIYLFKIPDFSANMYNYQPKTPLVPTEYIKKGVEGNELNFSEMTFHDIGHSWIMARQDTWLFKTSNRNGIELVTEWVRNKNWYRESYTKLQNTNNELYRAVKLYLFDIVHDRGYQFYLPILRQQFRALKNLQNIKTKITRGNFKDIINDSVLQHIDEARNMLLNMTDEFITKDNLDKIQKYRNDGYIVKRYLDVENYIGIPLSVIIGKEGKIMVNFDCDGIIKTASIYEIELLGLPNSEILTKQKINEINIWMNIVHDAGTAIDFVKLDSDANIIKPKYFDPMFINRYKDTCIHDKYYLKNIEIYKLGRLYNILIAASVVKFSITRLPDIYESENIFLDGKFIVIDNGICFALNEVSIENMPRQTMKYINLDAHDRFVHEDILRNSYIRNYNCADPNAKPYITINNDYELGIIDTSRYSSLSKAVSSLLTRSIEDAKDIYGGYLPPDIVTRAQLQYVSPHAISNLWGRTGYRFVLTRSVGRNKREIIGTLLIAKSKNTLFFFTSKYNNLAYSSMEQDVDWNLRIGGNHKWFDRFKLPDIKDYKPANCNQIANFAIEKIGCRNLGLGKMLIREVIKNYALLYMLENNLNINHSQHLICSKGLFQIADPSWREPMMNIGFKLRHGAETFYVDREQDPLPRASIGYETDNVSYNRKFGLPQIYNNIPHIIDNEDIHLSGRIKEVIELSLSNESKLQYFQMFCMFKDFKG